MVQANSQHHFDVCCLCKLSLLEPRAASASKGSYPDAHKHEILSCFPASLLSQRVICKADHSDHTAVDPALPCIISVAAAAAAG